MIAESVGIQFSGQGDDTDHFYARGWLNPLPPQPAGCEIPGWQRITFMKYFLDASNHIETDALWAYEGVVFPGGRIIAGRWWYAEDPSGPPVSISQRVVIKPTNFCIVLSREFRTVHLLGCRSVAGVRELDRRLNTPISPQRPRHLPSLSTLFSSAYPGVSQHQHSHIITSPSTLVTILGPSKELQGLSFGFQYTDNSCILMAS